MMIWFFKILNPGRCGFCFLMLVNSRLAVEKFKI
jgi:hypothetical protein